VIVEMKRVWIVLSLAGLLALGAGSASAQRYTPPSAGGGEESGTPESHAPDPFGLTLAASGAAAAVGYVVRRRRGGA